MKQQPNSFTLEWLYSKALREVGKPIQSSIFPNLNKKRQHNTIGNNDGDSSADKFTQPIKTVKAARLNHSASQTSFTDDNRYEALSDDGMILDDENNKEKLIIYNTHDKELQNQGNNSQRQRHHGNDCKQHSSGTSADSALKSQQVPLQATSHGQSTQQTGKKTLRERAPLITTTNINFKEVINLLNLKLGKNEFYIKKSEGNEPSIYSNNLNAFEVIKTILSNAEVKFYTYTSKHLRNKNLVLKGVDIEYSVDEVRKDIEDRNLNNVKINKVSELIYIKEKNYRLILVQLSNDSDTRTLTKEKFILHQGVKWEPLKKKNLHQCRKCHRVGHTSSNCWLDYRCVKCNVPHGPGECKIDTDKTDRSELYCVNCKKFGHPASYRGCSFLEASTLIMNKIKKQNSRKNNVKISKISEIVNSAQCDISKSYSHVVKSRQDDFHQTSNRLGCPQPPDFSNNSQSPAAESDLSSILENFRQKMLQDMKATLDMFYNKINENAARITDRATNGGGIAILIRKIPLEIIYSPSSAGNKIIEYTIISISKNLYIIALHANNDARRKFIDELNTLFSRLNLLDSDNYYIIAGDFNAHHTAWGDSIDKRKGILLETGLTMIVHHTVLELF